jgi:predicted nucleic acid-binding protein
MWACGGTGRFDALGEDLVGPPLLLSECSSVLHAAVWRREVSRSDAVAQLEQIRTGPVAIHWRRGITSEAWRIADQLGLAKTYDAEYLALAHLFDTRVVTLDMRLFRAAERLKLVVALNMWLDRE